MKLLLASLNSYVFATLTHYTFQSVKPFPMYLDIVNHLRFACPSGVFRKSIKDFQTYNVDNKGLIASLVPRELLNLSQLHCASLVLRIGLLLHRDENHHIN